MSVSVNNNSKETPFKVEQVNLGDILSERRIVSGGREGRYNLAARWLVLERQRDQRVGRDDAGTTIFNCLLLSYNAAPNGATDEDNAENGSASHWRIGLRRWIHLSNVGVWSIAVKSGLSWGDD